MLNLKCMNEIEEFINNNKMIEKNDKVLVAFSGGPDSVFLFHVLDNIKYKYNLQIGIIYVNHNIREDIDKDIEFVSKFSTLNNVELYIESVDVKGYSKNKKLSMEMAARELRYEKISDIKMAYKYTKIATGHNLDDNVETFLFRLIRGTSLNGLKSIPLMRDDLIRPILKLEKSYILNELKNNNEEFLIDYTNKDNSYSRNIIRNEIFPHFDKINPRFREKIINIIDEISRNEDIKEQSKLHDIQNKIISENRLSIKELLNEASHFQNKVIVKYLEENNIEINKEKIKLIKQLMYSEGSKTINLSNDKLLFKEYGEFIIRYNNNDSSCKYDVKVLEFENFSKEIFDNYSDIYLISSKIFGDENEIIVRKKQNGDKIELQSLGHKSLKKIFIDKKIVKWERECVPVIEIVYKNMYNNVVNEIIAVGELAHSKKISRIKDFTECETLDKVLIIRRNNGR